MKILSVTIKNVKGIDNKTFQLDLIPNKPNILVAPNGFGKSSISLAFDSLKRDKIVLDDKHYHLNKSTNLPELRMDIDDGNGVITLLANDTSNTISDMFDIFVINCQLTAKATLLKIGGTPIAKSSMEIEQTILISTIPQEIDFGYNFTEAKKEFGTNGKILPNIKL